MFKRTASVVFLAIMLSANLAFAFSGFATVMEEKQRISSRIPCKRKSFMPPGTKTKSGSQWGCYSSSENVKLWINGQPYDENAVKNIKLAATVFQNSKMETDARIWSDIIAELYGGDNAAKISEAFLKGKNQQFRGEFIVDVRFYKRPKANDHFIIVTSPQ
jgi:hypothetical protein